MGVRSWPLVGVLAVSLLAAILSVRLLVANNSNGRFAAVLAGATAMITTVGTIAGPLMIAPALATMSAATGTVSLRANRTRRAAIAIAYSLAVVVPLLLQFFGVLPTIYEFEANIISIRPMMLSFPEVPSLVTFSAISVMTIAAAVVLAGRWVDTMATAERQQQLRAWQLRQFVPDAETEL